MESLFGLCGDDFTIIAADRSGARSIISYKQDEDKIVEVASHQLLGCVGNSADRVSFADLIQKNFNLHRMRKEREYSVKSAANFIRTELATALRRHPYECQSLFAGVDTDTTTEEAGKASLYWVDYLGSLIKADFAAHGHTKAFVTGVLDSHWKPGLTLEEGLDIIKKCIEVIHARFLIAQPSFTVKIVTKEGIRVAEM